MDISFYIYLICIGLLGLSFAKPLQIKGSNWVIILFIAVLGYYIVNIILFTASPSKFLLLSKDLILLAACGAIFSILQNRTWLLLLGLGLILWIVNGFAKKDWTNSYSSVDEDRLYNKGEYLALMKDKSSWYRLNNWAEDNFFRIKKAFVIEDENHVLNDFVLIDIPDWEENNIDLKNSILEQADIIYLEDNENVPLDDQIASSPIAFKKGIQTFVNDTLFYKQWGLRTIGATKAFKLLEKHRNKIKKTSKVFVLDTGISEGHPDFQSNYRRFGNKKVVDRMGHGSHCAGIIGATTNNICGIASFAYLPDLIEISAISVFNNFGMANQQSIIQGMIKASEAGADVISMSLGAVSVDSRQTAYSKAVDYANGKNTIVVAAAGNSKSPAKGYSPANADGIVCVSAIDDKNQLAPFSNTIEDIKYGLAAPGVDIVSTYKSDTYQMASGTSMAAPHVAGAIAVLKALDPDMTTNEVYKILKSTGIPSNSVNKSGPIIQLDKAVESLIRKKYPFPVFLQYFY